MRAVLLSLCLGVPVAATAAPCGGDFAAFLDAMATEARAAGLPDPAVESFFREARQDPGVLKSDRGQGVFRKTFLEFSQALISKNRLTTARAKSESLNATFARAEADFGVSRGILLAFWAFETDFGQVQGDFNTRNALLTLAHDCRRPEIFQPQVLAAVKMHALGEFDLDTTGAWAGEIGMVQMLPKDILEKGIDGDGDGLVTLKTSPEDALLSGANLLKHHGWRANEPWAVEVTLPETFDWAQTGLHTTRPDRDWSGLGVRARQGDLSTGLPASILLPQGRKGPAFLVYPNFSVLFEWNKSFTYVMTAAYFATRIEGAEPYRAANPDPQLDLEEMQQLQRKLAARGHDVGEIDGILGAGTRAAVQREQVRLGLPADAWPTRDLLDRL